jgi:hypothetical protein
MWLRQLHIDAFVILDDDDDMSVVKDKLVQTIVQVWDSQEAYDAFAISDLMKRELVATIKDTYRATKNIVREETSVTA